MPGNPNLQNDPQNPTGDPMDVTSPGGFYNPHYQWWNPNAPPSGGSGGSGPGAFGPSGPPGAMPPIPPATNWLSPVLGTAVPVAGQLLSAWLQSHATTESGKLQAAAIAAALEWEKKRYGDVMGYLHPYIQSGMTASDRATELLGLPARPGTTATGQPTPGGYWPPQGPSGPPQGPSGGPPRVGIGAPAPPQHGPASGPPGASEMVLMRAPDGTTKQVPASEIDHWTRLGATVVGGPA